jgi:amino acid permease|uniref:Uncharacterized protein n=1 Tax=Pseudomonas phage Arace01 TaxID=3138526 RepID=A0AAU6W0G1_9VIRU
MKLRYIILGHIIATLLGTAIGAGILYLIFGA